MPPCVLDETSSVQAETRSVRAEPAPMPAATVEVAAKAVGLELASWHQAPQGQALRPGVRLGVDVGAVRIGVARSDPGGLLATPLETVKRGAGDLAELVRLVTENEAMEVVVGLAVRLAGGEGKSAADGRAFAAALAARLVPVPVRMLDERFTTVLAHAALAQGGHGSRARRETVDMAAAALLLQGALDAERTTGAPAGQLVATGGAA